MFPITRYQTVASGQHTDLTDDEEYYDPTRGAIFYNASTPSIKNGFKFDNNNAILILSHYTVKAPGEAEITNEMMTLAMSNQELTKIIANKEILLPDFRLHASFIEPEQRLRLTHPFPRRSTRLPSSEAAYRSSDTGTHSGSHSGSYRSSDSGSHSGSRAHCGTD